MCSRGMLLEHRLLALVLCCSVLQCVAVCCSNAVTSAQCCACLHAASASAYRPACASLHACCCPSSPARMHIRARVNERVCISRSKMTAPLIFFACITIDPYSLRAGLLAPCCLWRSARIYEERATRRERERERYTHTYTARRMRRKQGV